MNVSVHEVTVSTILGLNVSVHKVNPCTSANSRKLFAAIHKFAAILGLNVSVHEVTVSSVWRKVFKTRPSWARMLCAKVA